MTYYVVPADPRLDLSVDQDGATASGFVEAADLERAAAMHDIIQAALAKKAGTDVTLTISAGSEAQLSAPGFREILLTGVEPHVFHAPPPAAPAAIFPPAPSEPTAPAAPTP